MPYWEQQGDFMTTNNNLFSIVGTVFALRAFLYIFKITKCLSVDRKIGKLQPAFVKILCFKM